MSEDRQPDIGEISEERGATNVPRDEAGIRIPAATAHATATVRRVAAVITPTKTRDCIEGLPACAAARKMSEGKATQNASLFNSPMNGFPKNRIHPSHAPSAISAIVGARTSKMCIGWLFLGVRMPSTARAGYNAQAASMAEDSSGENEARVAASTFSSICSFRLAPMSTDVTNARERTQESDI